MVRAGPGESSAVPAQDVSGTVRSSRGCLTLFPAPLGCTGFCMVLCLHTAQDGTVALGQAPLLCGPFSLSLPVGPASAMLSDHTHVCTHAHTRPTWSHCSRGFSCHFLAHDSHLPPCALDPGTPLLPSRFSLLIHRHPDPWTKFTVSPAETASSHLLCPAPCLPLSWTVLHPVPTSGPICPPPGPLWILCIHPADAFGESFSLQSMARLTFLNTD